MTAAEIFDKRSLFHESSWNMDPYVAYYLNGIMAVVLMAAISMRYKVSNDGLQDYFLWITHLVAWGQNFVIFILSLVYDSNYTRQMYMRSSSFAGFAALVGLPIYIVWFLAYHSFDRDDKHPPVYFWGWLVFWVGYTLAMYSYTTNILVALYNYWMLLVAEDL